MMQNVEKATYFEQAPALSMSMKRRYRDRTPNEVSEVSTESARAQTALISRGVRGMAPAGVADLAWELADLAGPLISDPDRLALFTDLGAGEHSRSITLALELLVAARKQLPIHIIRRLHQWVGCYVGNPDEYRLRQLVWDVSTPSASRSAAS